MKYGVLAIKKCRYFHRNTESTGRYVDLTGLLVHVCYGVFF